MKKLSNEEKNLICQIATSIESGGHLIRPRSDEFKEMYNTLARLFAKEEKDRTQQEKLMLDYYFSCFPEPHELQLYKKH